MKEQKNLEFKQEVTNTFLKTVSAFANYESGTILFGVDDHGNSNGIKNPDGVCLDIENKINDAIKPKPSFTFSVNRTTQVIHLTVQKGVHTPYLYKGKAYRRSGTATVEVDQIELKRLVMAGNNLYFEQLESAQTTLSFDYLAKALKDVIHIERFTTDVQRTLGFFTDTMQYNHVAELFGDKNAFYGIDIVRFGRSINQILDRETLTNQSILKQYDQAVIYYQKHYQMEEIKGVQRELKEMVPEVAFREAVANALIHRTWDVNAHIRIEMHPEHIKIASPGGLPTGVSEDEYLNGMVSILRNPMIGNIFFRLHLIEMFGTGIRRIVESYSDYTIKPTFEIFEHSITVTLPIVSNTFATSHDENVIIDILRSGMILASSEIAQSSHFSKDKVVRLLNQLIDKQYISVTGKGRGTKYRLRS